MNFAGSQTRDAVGCKTGMHVAHRRCLIAIVLTLLTPPLTFAKWEKVSPADFSELKPSDFSDDELDLPYCLQHLHQLANAVVEDGPDRGFFNTGLWRGEGQKHTYNARIMESYLTLAYFYCTDRPWNQYYKSQPVRDRLEAALTYWCNMQGPEGAFSEYAPNRWGTAPTAFATKFMGETLRLLKNGPPIDQTLFKRCVEADRKALVYTFTSQEFWDHGKTYTNQYSNAFAGALAWANLFPGPQAEEVMKFMRQRFEQSLKDFQSPAGYMYELDGPDFGYTLHTTRSDWVMAYNYARGTEMGKQLEQQESRWAEWLSYNMLRQPDGSLFILNRAVETRQRHPTHVRQDVPMAEHVELSRAFATSTKELAEQHARDRKELEENWKNYFDADARANHGLEPYDVIHRSHYEWHPTPQQQAAAIAKLPYLARDRFIHQRADDRHPYVFTYVRRPTYYAAFNAAPRLSAGERFGLGIIWNPKAGAVMQSQTASDDFAWGTRKAGADQVYEAANLTARFQISGEDIEPQPGCRDLPDGVLVARYKLADAGSKSITFDDTGITVEVQHAGPFVEQIPLLLRDDAKPQRESGKCRVSLDGGVNLTIQSDTDSKPELATGNTLAGSLGVSTIKLTARDHLKYTITLGQ
jgi:hypothetical protein